MPLLFISNLLRNSTFSSISIPDNFSQNFISKTCGKDAIDAKNKKNNKDKREKTVEEVENERLYKEKIKEEYSKREGGI